MIRKFKRMSISAQAAFLMMLMLLGTASAFFFWATDNGIKAELQHSRTVADMADAFRTVAAKNGGFYIRRESSDDVQMVGRYLAEFTTEPTKDGRQYIFHQKNPFLAIGDYSAAVQNSPAAAKFRITSDNYMNPANQPDLFDLAAMKDMRESGATETWAIVKGQLRYARALRAEKACLSCHGIPQDAPSIVQSNYRAPIGSTKGGGYGYEEGQVVGVTSVTVPHLTPLAMLAQQSVGFWASIAVVLSLMAGSFWLAVRGVVGPLKRLSAYANTVANAGELEDLENLKDPVFDKDESNSGNEIHRQAFAVKSLRESMQAAMTHIKRHRIR